MNIRGPGTQAAGTFQNWSAIGLNTVPMRGENKRAAGLLLWARLAVHAALEVGRLNWAMRFCSVIVKGCCCVIEWRVRRTREAWLCFDWFHWNCEGSPREFVQLELAKAPKDPWLCLFPFQSSCQLQNFLTIQFFFLITYAVLFHKYSVTVLRNPPRGRAS